MKVHYWLRIHISFVLLIVTIVSSVHDFRIDKWVSDPQVRSGATMTAVGNDLYLLMGFNECFDFINLPGCFNIFYNSTEIWKYSTINQEWDKIITTRKNTQLNIFNKIINLYNSLFTLC